MLGPREPPAQAVDCLARPGRELGRLVAAGFQELGHRGQRRGGGPPELGPAARWPKEHDRADSEGGRESPALEPVRIAEFGAGSVTGRTKVSRAPVEAAAKYPLIAPARSVTKPMTAIAPAATHSLREQSVPSVMYAAPTAASPR